MKNLVELMESEEEEAPEGVYTEHFREEAEVPGQSEPDNGAAARRNLWGDI